MLNPKEVYELLRAEGIEFFVGVPDSSLKSFCAYVADNTSDDKNIIAANEGNAVAIAAGYHLATGKTGLVYMQNSGIGNAVNPLVSLADKHVYSIPMILLIGWRGEPGIKDEPQHIKQGMITTQILETLGINYEILSKEIDHARFQINKARVKAEKDTAPFALIARTDSFERYELKKKVACTCTLIREEVLEYILKNLNSGEIVVSTTGKTSREIYEIRERNGEGHEKDFLVVGSMGHASSIALGMNLALRGRKIVCIDGDGAFIMHMGAIAVIASHSRGNFKYIVINNGSHESVGGQPTVGFDIDMPGIASAAGFRKCYRARDRMELERHFVDFIGSNDNAFLEIRVRPGSRADLGRPKNTPEENKRLFMSYIRESGQEVT